MSDSYYECVKCGKIGKGCYMSHTEFGSMCDSCYNKLEKVTCRVCGEKVVYLEATDGCCVICDIRLKRNPDYIKRILEEKRR